MRIHLPSKREQLTILKSVALSFLALVITINLKAQWAFIDGQIPANWGTKGVPSDDNQPSYRINYARCNDNNGNIWIFGGQGSDAYGNNGNLNDLWKYSTSTNQWTWVSGNDDGTVDVISTYGTKGVADPVNVPCIRTSPKAWADLAGNIWIAGGSGIDVNGNNGYLNDLWKFNTKTNEWTWMNGSDETNQKTVTGTRGVPSDDVQPSFYDNVATISDKFGNFWLSLGSHLWKYTVSINQWTYLGKGNSYGVYGTKGIPATNNAPGDRGAYSAATDSDGNIWIFGGNGNASSNYGSLNDLWKYDPLTDMWTWVSGSNSTNQIGIYGTKGVASVSNHPGGRGYQFISIDAQNNIFVYGGIGYSGLGTTGALNDLWNYNNSSSSWTWLSGSKGANQSAVYGTKGVSSTDNHPFAEYNSQFTFNSSNKLYLLANGASEVWSYTTNNNKAPTISITSPDNNATYTAPATINISAAASDTDGTVIYVKFYNGSTLLKTDSTSPYTYTWLDVATGDYTITAKATDNGGLTTTSAAVNISVTNKAPVVSITSPANNAVYISPATININATATDSDGTISKVQFYSNLTLLQTDTVSPYTFSWTDVQTGNYLITAIATDNNGLAATSDAINISVVDNKAPVVTITDPVNNASYAAPATININASASDSDGTISYVQFYNGSTLLKTDSTSPYTFTWSNVGAGNHSLTAKATDNLGLTSTSSIVSISVTATNLAPAISIVSPDNNTVVAAPATITITATATDADGTVSSVKFYNGTTYLKTVTAGPYTYTLSNLAAGTYSLTAKATDNSGLQTTSQPVTITVLPTTANKAPVVKLTAPANNAVYTAPATIDLAATAIDADADGTISKVLFYGGSTLLKTDSTSPYTCTVNNVSAGNYSFTAKAVDDKGLSNSSASVVVAVSVAAENKAPSVSIINPVGNVVYNAGATINISAAASDTDGAISVVKFYSNGALLGVDSTSPYTYTLNNAATGNYSLIAKATDNKGLSGLSSGVYISVAGSTNKAPTVRITSPANNSTYTAPAKITINALAADADGTISSVKFYNGTTYLKTITASPYTYTITGLAAGTYSLTAKATDNLGAQTISAAVKVTVTTLNKAPTVSITSPANNSTYTAPATITINSLAADADGTISSVKFYNGTTYLKTVFTSPYTCTITGLAAGTYSLTAKATDNLGSQTISSSVSVKVLNTSIVGSKPYLQTEKTALNDALNLRLAPNPASNIVNIYTGGLQQSKPATLSVISVSGIVLKTMRISNAATPLDVSSLVSGVYMIKVISGEKVLYKQFVKL